MKDLLIVSLITSAAIIWAACSAASGPGSLTLKYPDVSNQEVALKSGGFYTSTKTWTKPDKKSTSASYFFCVADYDLDLEQGAISIGEEVKEGQIKVCFSLDGPEGSDDQTALTAGTYPIAESGPGWAVSSVSTASIRTFADGKESKYFINSNKANGQVKITSASSDSASGEINLSDGEFEISGTFSAKAYERE